MLVHKTARLETARSACYAAIPWLLQPALPQAHVTLNPDAPCFTPPHNISLLARTDLQIESGDSVSTMARDHE